MRRRMIALAAVLTLAAACTGGDGESSGPSASPTPEPWRGTLRVASFWIFKPPMYDPQRAYHYPYWEVLRCCLVRTLFAYPGVPLEDGGAEPTPDLALGAPEVSSDLLTWTFRLRSALRYAPPYDDVEITSGDVVRALERTADPKVVDGVSWPDGGYPSYFSVIRGFDEYRDGRAASISGLETPDPHTLVVRLEEPTGDLPHRFALPATAPIPEGAADGHRDYGPFLVSSGPYMIEGSEARDPSLPPREQTPAVGFVGGVIEGDDVVEAGSVTLVRNPSWGPETDPIRGAYVDRIEIRFLDELTTSTEVWGRVTAGELDTILEVPPGPVVDEYTSAADLRDRVLTAPGNVYGYIPMNLAVPPFDDLHVRKAVMLAVDREAIARRYVASGWPAPVLAGHLLPDSLTGNLLAEYEPYPYGDLEAARGEMARSAYDADGDGRCDAQVCTAVPAMMPARDPYDLDPLLVRNLRGIGIDLRVRSVIGDYFSELQAGEAGILLQVVEVPSDHLDASHVYLTSFASETIGKTPWNYSLVGATDEQLRELGLPRVDIPSVDDRIDRCMSLMGSEETACWAELERYVMEEVVPWIPMWSGDALEVVSERVAEASLTQWTGMVALDRVALGPGSE